MILTTVRSPHLKYRQLLPVPPQSTHEYVISTQGLAQRSRGDKAVYAAAKPRIIITCAMWPPLEIRIGRSVDGPPVTSEGSGCIPRQGFGP